MAHLEMARIVAVLAQRNYGLFTLGNSISLIGVWMQRIASGWLAWTLTESAGWVGAIAFADLFPVLLVGPFAGAAADRFDRMRALMIGRLAMLAQAVLLMALYYAGLLTIWPLFLITLFNGTVSGAMQPFRLAITSALVGRDWLPVAVAMNSVTFNLARFIGPAGAGLAIAMGGMGLTFAITAATCLVFTVTLSFVRVDAMPEAVELRGGFLADTMHGLRRAAEMPGVRDVILQLLLSGLLVRPVIELLPGWAAEVFSGTAAEFAALTSAFGVGAVVGGLWLAARPGIAGLTAVLLATNLGTCATLLLFAAVVHILPAMALALAVGFCMVASSIATQTLVQVAVPDGLRGRVLAVYGLVMRGGVALGALAMGIASDLFGMRPPLLVGVAVFTLVTLWYLRQYACLRDMLERADPPD